jgi:hypothetical protein
MNSNKMLYLYTTLNNAPMEILLDILFTAIFTNWKKVIRVFSNNNKALPTGINP